MRAVGSHRTCGEAAVRISPVPEPGIALGCIMKMLEVNKMADYHFS
jgi:hypothetical protein